ncbi:hypothetical protein [Paenibacillus sp. CF095]|uniref:hypothetical protein n=1 Tax=Paenibacillus sp. CF095 TaxID=1881033 RepID=UPI0015A3CE6B|nr:hypothetical protein [Paenibacillus sp. CF095]
MKKPKYLTIYLEKRLPYGAPNTLSWMKGQPGVTWKDLQEKSFNKMFGWDEVIPGLMDLTPLGDEACKLLGLDELSETELEELIRNFKSS